MIKFTLNPVCSRKLGILTYALPGAGKGTLGKKLEEIFPNDIYHYNSGLEMFRAGCIPGPNLVPDNEMVFAPFRKRYLDPDAEISPENIVYLDGLFRRVDQGQIVEEILSAGWDVVMLFLNVSDEIAHKRMFERAQADASRSGELDEEFRARRIKLCRDNQSAITEWLDQKGIKHATVNAMLTPDQVLQNALGYLVGLAPHHFSVTGLTPVKSINGAWRHPKPVTKQQAAAMAWFR